MKGRGSLRDVDVGVSVALKSVGVYDLDSAVSGVVLNAAVKFLVL